MRFLTLAGRDKSVDIAPYRLDWDKPSLSKFQFKVKQFLREFWFNHVMYEEMKVAGTRMKIDLYNATKRVAIECDGKQHGQYNKHFHNGSASTFFGQIDRDNKKDRWCEMNGITLIRVEEDEVSDLSRAWFKSRGIDL